MTAGRKLEQGGFTLLELMLSIMIITILTGISLPLYESFARRNNLDITTQSVAAAIRRAETYARGNNGDSVWGIAIQTTSVTLFKGTSYAARTTAFDEVISLPGTVTASGLSEVTFAKLSAAPSSTGSLTLTSTTSDSRTITINSEGMVDY